MQLLTSIQGYKEKSARECFELRVEHMKTEKESNERRDEELELFAAAGTLEMAKACKENGTDQVVYVSSGEGATSEPPQDESNRTASQEESRRIHLKEPRFERRPKPALGPIIQVMASNFASQSANKCRRESPLRAAPFQDFRRMLREIPEALSPSPGTRGPPREIRERPGRIIDAGDGESRRACPPGRP